MSPFPGMDPYLEDPARWPDFHHPFLVCLSEVILELLPDDFDCRIHERIRVEEPLTRRPRRAEGTITAPGNPGHASTIRPVKVPLIMEGPWRQRFLKIVKLPARKLVTTIELLSPPNKVGIGYGAYLAFRERRIWGSGHFVELDLLRQGHRLPMAEPLPPAHYYALVSRARARPLCDVY